MYPLTEISEALATVPAPSPAVIGEPTVTLLGDEDEAEVMAFLAERPLHTFTLAGFIRNNGVVSPFNRGVFYACRDGEGCLIGVALIGHFILFETRSDAATAAFAKMAQTHRKVHMLLGEQEKVQTFWQSYQHGGQNPRLYCREMLMGLHGSCEEMEPVEALRLATSEDLELIVPVHARTAYEESGINPLDVDPEGFRERCARRIQKGQTWVWIEDGKLIFKAEIVTDSPDVIYLEGVDVDPDERGKGYGSRCITQLCRLLLARTSSVTLMVNEKSPRAVAFYSKVGFKVIGNYDTIFLTSAYH
jgi:predicted GNAT family acetyltransferase